MERSNPQVSVLITHHINENDAYLEQCLRSVEQSEGVELDIIAISDAPEPPKWKLRPHNVIWNRTLVGVADKWRHALKVADPETTYFASISDDVMVSKDCLRLMAEAMGRQKAIMGPLSNCDNGSRYFAALPFPRKQTLEDLGDERKVIDYPAGPVVLLPQDWVGFYCVMIPKAAIEQIGELDKNLEVRFNDVDYCLRAKKLGIPSLIHLGAFAWHAGDRTIPKVTTPEQYALADESMREKYACEH